MEQIVEVFCIEFVTALYLVEIRILGVAALLCQWQWSFYPAIGNSYWSGMFLFLKTWVVYCQT
jgi:hypothetical protein